MSIGDIPESLSQIDIDGDTLSREIGRTYILIVVVIVVIVVNSD